MTVIPRKKHEHVPKLQTCSLWVQKNNLGNANQSKQQIPGRFQAQAYKTCWPPYLFSRKTIQLNIYFILNFRNCCNLSWIESALNNEHPFTIKDTVRALHFAYRSDFFFNLTSKSVCSLLEAKDSNDTISAFFKPSTLNDTSEDFWLQLECTILTDWF